MTFWRKPSTPIWLMLAWHGLAIVIGITLVATSGSRAAAGWFAAGIIGIPVITIAALIWSAQLRKAARPGASGQPVRLSAPATQPTPPKPTIARQSAPVPAADDDQEAPFNVGLVGWAPSEQPRPSTPAPATRAQLRATNSPAPSAPPAPRVEYFVMGSEGYPWMEVEGEFARTPAIQRVVGRKLRLNEELELEGLPTELRPEPTNKYDRNAVMVIINGHHVGYLGRDNAAEYVEPLACLTRAGVIPMVRSRLWVATRRDWEGKGTKTNARVTLAIGKPDTLAPMNNPPAAPYSLVPWGSGLQVTGEEHHLDALSDFVTPSGDGIAIGSLHILEVPAAKGATREVAEVRLDGERIGQMTPGTSAHFLPTVKHLADQGLVAAVWVRVKGSAVAAQAVLQATKAHELPADWFGAPATVPSLYPQRRAYAIETEVVDDVAQIVEERRPVPMWDD